MGKMKRSYRIFILFLLVTVLSFSAVIRTRVEGIDSKNYDEIKIDLVSITNNDVSSMKLLNVNEDRQNQNIGYSEINMSKITLNEVIINGSTYYLDGNNKTTRQVTGYNGKQYVYEWTGTYNTKFTEEKGEKRTIYFDAERTMKNGRIYPVTGLLGSYVEPNKPVGAPSSQWIYSQITRTNLVNSDKYTVSFYDYIDTIKTIDEDGSLEELLKTEGGYSGSDSFTSQEQERYEYIGNLKSIIEFKLKETSEEIKNGKFELTIEEDNVFKRKINESYTIPVPITGFEEQDLESSKNTFTYEDEYELENLKAYKYQEAVFRLYTGSKHDGVRPIKKIEENELSNSNYVDFVFENNGSTQEIEKNGIKAKFIEGKFELMGLEDRKSYKLDFYTLRYRDNDSKGNYAAVTYEGSSEFNGKNVSSTDDTIWLEDIDISEYKKIKLNMITVTTEDLSALSVLDLNETRDGQIESEDTRSIAASKVLLNKIWIAEKEYEVADNQITLADGKKKYVYEWIGSYDTEFEQEEGMIREIKLYPRGYKVVGEDFEGGWLTGKYIEPTLAEVDTGASHQWVMFEFNPEKEFKDQNYKIEDRVLSPEREGYRRLKTVNYESNLDDILYGKAGQSLIKNEFTYNNGVWSYPANISSTGLIIEKTITESKGTLKDEDGEGLVFYTDNIGSGIEKLGETGNKVTYRWNEGPLNTNGEILNYDKVIFRITKKITDVSSYYWNPYEDSNSINLIEPTIEGNKKLEAFLYGNINGETYNKNYVDLVLDASTSKTMTFTNAIISYEQTNKELRIVGLPVDNYTIQFYSVKRGHDGAYKVVTRENQSEFKMDISDIASPNFEKENNIHKIDFITVGEEKGNIQVNVNFITKMERAIDLKVDNLKFGDFNIEEINEGTGEKEGIGEAGNLNLKESDMKKFLFPLDVVFVIDNSGSMQSEIDNVKDGLTAFGRKLLNRGFDVKYNLITFGPQQNRTYENWGEYFVPTGDWQDRVSLYDRDYMAIYKDGTKNKWFNGSTLNKTSSRENDLEELVDAFEEINSISGYYGGQENSAWGIHYAIKKLRENGRYLSYSGEIVEDSNKGYMPSEKMIIFLTDEDMDSQNIGDLGYTSSNVLEKLYSKLNSTYNGMPDNIDLNGIFHIKKDGNTAEGANEYLTTYDKEPNEEVPGLGYKYTSGYNLKKEWVAYYKYKWHGNSNNGWWEYQGEITREEWNEKYEGNSYYTTGASRSEEEWIEYDDNEIPILGENTSNVSNRYDPPETSHTDFKYYNTGNNFFMYEMKNNGSGVENALNRAINNLGIIQRWELSYLTPFNEYDGTTRTVNFEFVDLEGRDGKSIDNNKIVNLNREEDKQYTVKEEKLTLEFKDPSVDNLKLSIVDGRGTITFRGKARYNEFDEENNPIVVEDMINEYKLDVLDSNNKLLFSRNTDSIEMSLSDEGWLGIGSTTSDISGILTKRELEWVEITPKNGTTGQEILGCIYNPKYTIGSNNEHSIAMTLGEVDAISNFKGSTTLSSILEFRMNETDIKINKEDLERILGGKVRQDTWYEISNSTEDEIIEKGLENLVSKYSDFEKIESNKYRIKLRNLGLTKLIDSGDSGSLELKISETKLDDLVKIQENSGEQGWYEFKIELTEDEMKILKESEVVKLDNEIKLEATIVTDLFNRTETLDNVDVDLSPAKITNISVVNDTIKNFLEGVPNINSSSFTGSYLGDVARYSGYNLEVDDNFTIPVRGGYGKDNDEITITLKVEGKNINKYDVTAGISILEDLSFNIESSLDEEDGKSGLKKFTVKLTNLTIPGGISNVTIKNKILNSIGIIASQEEKVLEVDNDDIAVAPIVIGEKKIDSSYYVKSNYAIDLSTVNSNLIGAISTLVYDNEKADRDEDGKYYGSNSNYYSINKSNIFSGGKNDSSTFNLNIDTGGEHTTDGEYQILTYAISNSGKLNGITGYDRTFNEILVGDILKPKNLTVIVDTIAPKITNILKEESTENSDELYYYFDLSFDIEDFNASYEKIGLNPKGGYELDINDGTQILGEPTYDSNKTITYKLKVDKSTISGAVIAEVTITAEDKAGNRKEKIEKIRVPKDIKINTYEELYQKEKSNVIKGGYKFTKGGLGSNISNPAIYVTVPASDSEDEERIGRLIVEKIDGDETNTNTKEVSVPEGNSEKEVEITFNFREGANIVRVTPISVAGVKGKFKELKFVVDKRINDSTQFSNIIGEIDSKGKIQISINELSGISKYKYEFILDSGEKITGIDSVNFKSNITEQSNTFKIDISRVAGRINDIGGLLKLTVWDKLGHSKYFPKPYAEGKKSTGEIISTIKDEAKQRSSKVKIISDKFSIESSIDGSSEKGPKKPEEEPEKPEEESEKDT